MPQSNGNANRDFGVWDRLHRILRFRLMIPLKRGRQPNEYKARGVAVGMFWAMTPLVGIQMPLVMLTWIVLKPLKRFDFSVLVACAWTWVTNVFTLVPIYYVFYVSGQLLLGRMDDLTGYVAFSQTWHETFGAGQSTMDSMAAYGAWIAKEAGVAMIAGSVPFAIGGAFFGYRLSMNYLVRRDQRRRRRRQKRHDARTVARQKDAAMPSASSGNDPTATP